MSTDTETEEDVRQDGVPRSRAAAWWTAAQPWATLAVRLGLAGVLGYAGYTKVIVPALSVQSVEAYQLFGDGMNQFIGYTLPLFEIALALLLVVGLATRFTGAVGAAVMAVFIVGIISAWARGLSIDCGCFGTGGQVAEGETEYGLAIARDLGFMAMGLFIAIWPRSPFALDRVLGLDAGNPPQER